eukprot:Amastigsp_a845891_8.p4 type:complete len:194 gc:universal Amastigsp_a845891_8:1943-1362(-)
MGRRARGRVVRASVLPDARPDCRREARLVCCHGLCHGHHQRRFHRRAALPRRDRWVIVPERRSPRHPRRGGLHDLGHDVCAVRARADAHDPRRVCVVERRAARREDPAAPVAGGREHPGAAAASPARRHPVKVRDHKGGLGARVLCHRRRTVPRTPRSDRIGPHSLRSQAAAREAVFRQLFCADSAARPRHAP